MKHAIIFGLLLAASMHAYPHNVGRGSAVGGSQSAASAGASQGNGGRYSAVDEYQPWPQEEMKQYQKKEWTPYDGK
jgi:hypothetical protein